MYMDDEEVFDFDKILVSGDLEFLVQVGPPLEERQKRKKKQRIEKDEDTWMEDEELLAHELQRAALIPGTVPEQMIEQPVFMAWGGEDDLLGRALQKSKEAKTGMQVRQLRTILLSDQRCRNKVLLANDNKLVGEIIAAAAKRLGMSQITVQINEQGAEEPITKLKDKHNSKQKAEKGDKETEETSPAVIYKLHPDMFNIPVSDKVTPGDKAAILIQSKEAMQKLQMRCAGTRKCCCRGRREMG